MIIVEIIAVLFIGGLLAAIFELPFQKRGIDGDASSALMIGIVLVLWICKKIVNALGGFGAFFSIISTFLVPLLCLGIMLCLVIIFTRLKRRSYLKQLMLCGISSRKNIQCSEKVWRKLIKKGLVVELTPVYIMSNQFYDGIIEDINRHPLRSAVELQEIFCQNAPYYQMAYDELLFAELKKRNCLLEFSNDGHDKYYLSEAFIEECEHLLNVEGAATKAEFADLCNKSDTTTCLQINCKQLAEVIIEHMVATSKVDVRPLSTYGNLYVSKYPDIHTKMTKVELSI